MIITNPLLSPISWPRTEIFRFVDNLYPYGSKWRRSYDFTFVFSLSSPVPLRASTVRILIEEAVIVAVIKDDT